MAEGSEDRSRIDKSKSYRPDKDRECSKDTSYGKESQDTRNSSNEFETQPSDDMEVEDSKALYNLDHPAVKQLYELQQVHTELTESNRTLKSKYSRLKHIEGSSKELKRIWSHLEDNYFARYAVAKGLRWQGDDLPTVTRVIDELFRDAQEADTLSFRFQNLQQDILNKVKVSQPISDEQFVRDFGALASAIKSISRGIKLPSDLEAKVHHALKTSLLTGKVKGDYWTPPSRAKYLIEAFVWSTIIDHIFSSPFAVAGQKYSKGFNESFSILFGHEHDHNWPIPSELAERWRYTTMERIVEKAGLDALTKGTQSANDIDLFNSVQESHLVIKKWLYHILQAISHRVTIPQVSDIVRQACALSLQMSLQRSRIQIVYPDVGETYVQGSARLEDISEMDGTIDKGTVVFCVNPGMAKWGDAHGDNLEKRLDLVPAKVFVQPDPKSNMELPHVEGASLFE